MGLQVANRPHKFQPCAHGSLCVIFVGLRVAKVDQNAVTHELRHEASETTYSLGDTLLISEMTSRKSSGSMRAERAVEPTRSENITVTWRRWSKAKSAEGQVVLLSGEPGIGKSRLTAALLERLAAEPHTRLRYFCSPQHTDSPLYPIISQMERAAGFAHDEGLGKYEAAFRENEITEKVLPNLTAEDLKELGVAALGHRRTLLDAIAALRNDASGKTPSVDAATTSSAPSAHPEDRAEPRAQWTCRSFGRQHHERQQVQSMIRPHTPARGHWTKRL